MRRLAFAVVLFAFLVFVAAGCGKSEPKAVPTNEWANDICGDLVTWTTTMKSVASSVKANPTKSGAQDAVNQAKDATSTLTDSLKSLGKPDTSTGDQAKSDISALADQLSADIDSIESSFKNASTASEVLASLSSSASTLTTMSKQVSDTFGKLQQLDAKGELEKAFSSSANCKQLTSG